MLIIESGAGDPDAESYATAAELVSYAAKFGVTIPAEEAAQEALLRRAALAMNGMKWKGRRTHEEQALAWPREGVQVDGAYKRSNYIPREIFYGQLSLAGEIHKDDLSPPETRQGAVIRKRVEGAVEVEYAQISNTSGRLLPAAPNRASQTQFADYLDRRGLFAVRA
ncbi:DnaT-like ssDNA-binding protein [Pseudomonas sp.]|uniref:DnaT-like ssDNA-binding protein n=1 Tax=Pseudomonas sp. TaxID=306 RepID=UPI00289CA5E1|nr:DnaT-like ssDNA-binding protein [Pseudomonas sp.]